MPVKQKVKPGFIFVTKNRPETRCPRDGEWFEAFIGAGKGFAAQFDKTLNRFFTGKGHAVDEKAITAWRRAE